MGVRFLGISLVVIVVALFVSAAIGISPLSDPNRHPSEPMSSPSSQTTCTVSPGGFTTCVSLDYATKP